MEKLVIERDNCNFIGCVGHIHNIMDISGNTNCSSLEFVAASTGKEFNIQDAMGGGLCCESFWKVQRQF